MPCHEYKSILGAYLRLVKGNLLAPYMPIHRPNAIVTNNARYEEKDFYPHLPVQYVSL